MQHLYIKLRAPTRRLLGVDYPPELHPITHTKRKSKPSGRGNKGSINQTRLQNRRSTDRFFKMGDEVVPVLVFLQAGKRHFCTRDVLQGVIVIDAPRRCNSSQYVPTFLGFSRYSKRVSSFHTTPLLTLAAVYEKPSL